MSNSQHSKHRHISFTAHYTGYIWYQMGISHPALATQKGKILAKIADPIETLAERYIGGSMRTTLKARHTLLDEHLKQLIQSHPDLQILEIAAGLSPRGWWFREHFPQIDYRELDLPAMAVIKQNALQQIHHSSPAILSADLFTDDFKQAFDVFDLNRPLAIISEGLINYFDKTLLQQLLQAITTYGHAFKALHYLTDVYPEPIKNKRSKLIWSSSKLLKLMSRSAFSFHFKSPQEVQSFFKTAGFKTVDVVQPRVYFHQDSLIDTNVPFEQLNANEHLGDLVWMVHAQ